MRLSASFALISFVSLVLSLEAHSISILRATTIGGDLAIRTGSIERRFVLWISQRNPVRHQIWQDLLQHWDESQSDDFKALAAKRYFQARFKFMSVQPFMRGARDQGLRDWIVGGSFAKDYVLDFNHAMTRALLDGDFQLEEIAHRDWALHPKPDQLISTVAREIARRIDEGPRHTDGTRGIANFSLGLIQKVPVSTDSPIAANPSAFFVDGKLFSGTVGEFFLSDPTRGGTLDANSLGRLLDRYFALMTDPDANPFFLTGIANLLRFGDSRLVPYLAGLNESAIPRLIGRLDHQLVQTADSGITEGPVFGEMVYLYETLALQLRRMKAELATITESGSEPSPGYGNELRRLIDSIEDGPFRRIESDQARHQYFRVQEAANFKIAFPQ